MNLYEQRIQIAKRAIKIVRARTEYGFKAINPPTVIMTSPKEWAFGIIGILDFVATGDSEMILLHEVRGEVRKLLSAKQRSEHEK